MLSFTCKISPAHPLCVCSARRTYQSSYGHICNSSQNSSLPTVTNNPNHSKTLIICQPWAFAGLADFLHYLTSFLVILQPTFISLFYMFHNGTITSVNPMSLMGVVMVSDAFKGSRKRNKLKHSGSPLWPRTWLHS